MKNFQLPKLAPPGAGLPWLENFILRYLYYPAKLKQTTWSENLDRLQRETRNIINICEQLTEQEFQTRVLVQRLRGMEDSSRYWSAALTIDHLMITLKGMSYAAVELSQGREVTMTVGTADVKPKQEDVTNKATMLLNLKNLTDETVSKLKPFAKEHSLECKAAHPWFGKITADGWVWTLAQHQALHRRQIQMIVKQL
ncbi:MAG: DinB family protein [Proteobacteria bacterium]|jgi:hypothetical protein|nr:DinB family protein [Pseudomonadota bacterium]